MAVNNIALTIVKMWLKPRRIFELKKEVEQNLLSRKFRTILVQPEFVCCVLQQQRQQHWQQQQHRQQRQQHRRQQQQDFTQHCKQTSSSKQSWKIWKTRWTQDQPEKLKNCVCSQWLACYTPVLDGFDWHFKASVLFTLSCAIKTTKQHQKITEKFFQELWELNPGLPGEKQECDLCAMHIWTL